MLHEVAIPEQVRCSSSVVLVKLAPVDRSTLLACEGSVALVVPMLCPHSNYDDPKT